MDIEKELKRVADSYVAHGYQVKIRPGPEELPPFAKSFKVEIVATRGAEGVLVTVKKNREELEADGEIARYAEIVGNQPGWRFDLVILESGNPLAKQGDAKEPSDEFLNRSLQSARQLAANRFVDLAMIGAWAALEAAMRRRLRAAGEKAGWGSSPRQMIHDLYSTGVLSFEEFAQLEQVSQLRNEVVHGFVTAVDPAVVQFLTETAERLLEESQPAKQTAAAAPA